MEDTDKRSFKDKASTATGASDIDKEQYNPLEFPVSVNQEEPVDDYTSGVWNLSVREEGIAEQGEGRQTVRSTVKSVYDESDDDDEEEQAEEGSNGTLEEDIPEEDRITLSWDGICADTKPRGMGSKKPPVKKILTDASGIVPPGSLMALMGASGAGKTTLLNILNFRSTAGLEITGDVMINGHPVDQQDMCNVSVFVQQQDVFVGTLKVREHLFFHSVLRMKSSTKEERHQRIESIMRQMSLKRCEDVLIGIAGKLKGISGGEAKRLAFATEILTKPTLIFCDEPTSGLDSFMARKLVKLLKEYARVGRTIICTIHQPSSETFELFDQICIMAEGRCAFIGHAADCKTAFDKAGFPCPSNFNPSDHYVFTLAIVPGQEDRCRRRVAALTAAYEESPQCQETRDAISNLKAQPQSENFRTNAYRPSMTDRIKNIFKQFFMIIWRCMKTMLRDPTAFFLRIIVAIIMSLIVGCNWFKVDLTKEASQQNVSGALFFITAYISLSASMLLVVVIPGEQAVLTRDYLTGVYKVPIYYLALAFFYTAEVLLNTLIILNIIYWMVFNNTEIDAGDAYPTILAAYLVSSLTAISVGLFVSSMCNSFNLAMSIISPFNTVFMLYAGFMVTQDQIPDGLKFLQYLSYFYYALEIVMANIYKKVDYICELPGPNFNETLPQLEDHMLADDPDQNLIKADMMALCIHSKEKCNNFMSGQDVLDLFGTKDRYGRDIGALFGLMIGFNALGITILTTRMYLKRKGGR